MKSLAYYHYESHHVECTHCEWEGLGNQLTFGEMFDALFELNCPRCNQKVAMVGFPSFEEVLKHGTEAEKEDVRKSLHRQEELKDLELTKSTKLPKLSGSVQIRFEERYSDQKLILDIYANETPIFSEEVYYEYSERLMEIIKILSFKYKASIQSIAVQSSHDLCGDRYDSIKLKALIEQVTNQHAKAQKEAKLKKGGRL
jgi:hypothetical protein